MNVLTLDFETYWADDYTLSKMTTEAYVRDPRFKAHMVGMQMNDNAPVVIPHEKMVEVFSKIPWEKTAVVAQHAHFDLFILSHHYGIRPAFIFDTLSMFRALYPAEAASLANQCRVLGLPPKGLELINSKNKYNLSPHEYQELAGYCTNDVRLTRRIFDLLKPSFPVSELRLIDLTVRLFTEPVLRLNRTLLEDALEDEKKRMVALLTRVFPEREGEIWAAIVQGDKAALDAIKKPLSSNPQFAELLLNLGIDPPKKLSPAAVKKGIADPEYDYEPPIGQIDQLPKKALEVYRKLNNDAAHPSEKWAYAFSKSDEAFKHLLNHDDETVVGLVEARLGVKSTIRETRTQRFIGISSRGAWPVYLKYAAAHTLRWGGSDNCLAENTKITVLTEKQQVLEKNIQDVLLDDLVWDGVDFVEHDGVIFQGMQEVIYYDGIEATPDHRVYIEGEDAPRTLSSATAGNHKILVAGKPDSRAVDRARRHRNCY